MVTHWLNNNTTKTIRNVKYYSLLLRIQPNYLARYNFALKKKEINLSSLDY